MPVDRDILEIGHRRREELRVEDFFDSGFLFDLALKGF
jgi:hypothetical protein